MAFFIENLDNYIEKWRNLQEASSTFSYFQSQECFEFYSSLYFMRPFAYGVEENGELLFPELPQTVIDLLTGFVKYTDKEDVDMIQKLYKLGTGWSVLFNQYNDNLDRLCNCLLRVTSNKRFITLYSNFDKHFYPKRTVLCSILQPNRSGIDEDLTKFIDHETKSLHQQVAQLDRNIRQYLSVDVSFSTHT